MSAGMRRRAVTISDGLVMGILIGFFAGAVTVSLIAFSGWFRDFSGFSAWVDSFAQNFGTEMFGAFLTFFLIEMLRGSRREREEEALATEEWKQALIRAMGSTVKEDAVRATEELRAAGWLEDGSLRGAKLSEANLEGANLLSAELPGAMLAGAKLQGAIVRYANLEGAEMSVVNLLRADLQKANLQGAILWAANLRGANLWRTNLQEANLTYAKLRGAAFLTLDQLRAAELLVGATLPDGTELPDDDTWREAFEAWCKTVAVDEQGQIVRAALDDDEEEDG